jgi:hypothetical protein
MSGNNILYFSERCPYSKKLIAKIFNTSLFDTMQKVCVDTMEVRKRLPKFVVQTDKIPLVYLSQPSPKFGQLLYEDNMWLWVDEQLRLIQTAAVGNFNQPRPSDQPGSSDQQVHNQSGQRGPPPPEPGNTSNKPAMVNDGDGFMAYNPLEMSGGISSDLYAPFTGSDGQAPYQPLYPHSYETVAGLQGQSGVNTNQTNQTNQNQAQQQQSGSGSRTSQKHEKFEQDFAMLQAMRKSESYAQDIKPVTGIPQNFDQQWSQKNNTGRSSYVQ